MMDLTEETRLRLRKFSHDVKSPLSVIVMGLEALKNLRQDEQMFLQVYQMIEADGVENLRRIVAQLDEDLHRKLDSHR